tara:strand:- start:7288 stop:7812 length:525 start_codon:yes stop_codon:yes gene_type:complete
MCSPLVSVAMGVAQSASSIIGQRQQAEMQEQAQATASAQERQRYLAEVSAMRTQEQQEMIARAQRVQEASRRAMEARSRATVAAGESGISGLSVSALLGDLTRKEAEYTFSEQRQAEMASVGRQIQLQESGIGFNRNMLRINRPIEQPDYLGSALGGIQTGLSNYSVMKNAGLI